MRDFFVLQMSMWTLKSSILFLQMGHSFNPLQWDSPEQPQCYNLLVTGNGELGFCWDGLKPCTCMLLHGGVHDPFVCWVQAVVELLEGLTCNLFSKGVLELETWVAIQRMCIFESADLTTHL